MPGHAGGPGEAPPAVQGAFPSCIDRTRRGCGATLAALQVWYTLDRPPPSWAYSSGFINEDMIKEHLPSASADTQAGPTAAAHYMKPIVTHSNCATCLRF